MPLAPATITRIVVDWDEDSCECRIEYEGDSYMHSAVIADPEAFYDAVKAGIGPWLHERELARKTAPTPLYVDDSGYDLSDPKHPRYHSVHADLWDSRCAK